MSKILTGSQYKAHQTCDQVEGTGHHPSLTVFMVASLKDLRAGEGNLLSKVLLLYLVALLTIIACITKRDLKEERCGGA